MTSSKAVAAVITTPTAVLTGARNNMRWGVWAAGICASRVTLRHNVIADRRSFRASARTFLVMLTFLFMCNK